MKKVFFLLFFLLSFSFCGIANTLISNDLPKNNISLESPDITITSNTPNITDGSSSGDSSIVLVFTISETTSNFVVGDITLGNGSLSSFTGSGAYYTAVFTPTGNGACTIDVAANKFTNSGNENNTAATQFNWTYDGTVPTVSSITSTKII